MFNSIFEQCIFFYHSIRHVLHVLQAFAWQRIASQHRQILLRFYMANRTRTYRTLGLREDATMANLPGELHLDSKSAQVIPDMRGYWCRGNLAR